MSKLSSLNDPSRRRPSVRIHVGVRYGDSRGGRNAQLAPAGARLGDTDPGADGERVSVQTLGEGCEEFEACEFGHHP